ncbi:MAG: arginine deiminase family protein [Bacteroidia bacterium]|nr:arginine deiminase family protein [Bacteroidia bacterium]
MDKIKVGVSSEIGLLEGVILHTPGHEVENMTPENAQRALYSDILNLSVATKEYVHLKGVLEKVTHTFEVKDLLRETIEDDRIKEDLVRRICIQEDAASEVEFLLNTPNTLLAIQLIEGVVLRRDNLTRFLSKERYSMRPLHNFLFTRDASMTLWDEVLIGKMASKVREREPLIMEAIFKNHPAFSVKTINPATLTANLGSFPNATIEGGDVQIAREDVLVVGTGSRTSTEGIDYLIEVIKAKKTSQKHIIIQELPDSPESFIHLDMTFTFLDKDVCMVYDPLILKNNKFHTIQITIDNGKVNSIGFNLDPVFCGGKQDPWIMEREQWHSGANFFAFAPGKVIGYERNDYTLDEMSKHGFEIIRAVDLIENRVNPDDFQKAVITIPGSELARGGGGARCMTMPICRQKVDW